MKFVDLTRDKDELVYYNKNTKTYTSFKYAEIAQLKVDVANLDIQLAQEIERAIQQEGTLKASVDSITTAFNNFVSIENDSDDIINRWNEVVTFLDNINETQDLVSLLNNKVDKVSGKQLSTEDFTTEEKNKLASLSEVAQSDWNATEGNGVILNKPDLGVLASKDQVTISLLDDELQAKINSEETDPTVPDWAKAETKPSYTKSEVGLSNVDNTSDVDKPISTATQTALDNKVDKVDGKGLSTIDFDNDMLETLKKVNLIAEDLDKRLIPNITSNTENITSIQEDINNISDALINKVDVEEGKGLSSNDFTDEQVTQLASCYSGMSSLAKGISSNASSIGQLNSQVSQLSSSIDTKLDTKVDKEFNKGLSTNDYTWDEKNKLAKIEENANNYVHPTTSGNKHIPEGGSEGQLLTYDSDGTAKWSDSSSKLDEQFATLNKMWEQLQEKQEELNKQVTEFNQTTIDLHSYGVEWDPNVSSPILTRIGNPLLHKQLPIQSSYRGCIFKDGLIQYYLHPDDWTYKADGTEAVLDGTDGDVRVHVMKFYGKSGTYENGKRWVRISTYKIDDSWVEIPEMVIDAYLCTIDQANSKTASVVNFTANYRGGQNRSSYDVYMDETNENYDPYRSDLGKCRTSLNLQQYITYAANAGSEVLCYEYYKWIFYWCYVIEYANFNFQADYNAELTSDGYHQGGLGAGPTTHGDWSNYNGYNPAIPNGYTNEFGNGTGIKDIVLGAYTVSAIRWRGFENNFGHIWIFLAGMVIVYDTENNRNIVYTSRTDFTNAVGTKTIAGYTPVNSEWVSDFDLGETGEIIPSKLNGGSSTYMCDYKWDNSSTTMRHGLAGGRLSAGSFCGGASLRLSYGLSYSAPSVGARTLTRL